MRFFALLLLPITAVAQKIDAPQYAVSLIPDSLLKGANAVLRYYSKQVNVISPTKIKVVERRVTTVLNNKGDDLSKSISYYDHFSSIRSIKSVLWDHIGKVIDKSKRSEVMDVPDVYEFSLSTDTRYKVVYLTALTYPYTVEHFVEYELSTSFYPIIFQPIDQERLSVQSAVFSLQCPKTFPYYFKYYNFLFPLDSTASNETYNDISLSLSNFKAISAKPYSLNYDYLFPEAVFRPAHYYLEDRAGSNNSWSEFGNFFSSMYKGSISRDYQLKAQVDSLISGSKTSREKILRVYGFLQRSCRYVLEVNGIEGWKPFPPSYVFKNGYGDCKALTNYMSSILDYLGIPSYPALVNAGEFEYPFDTSFCYNQFNHVVLCVPIENDTLWFECTSNDAAPGGLGVFTENRFALLLLPDGAKIVRTPITKPLDNRTFALVKIDLKVDGTSNGTIKFESVGYPSRRHLSFIDMSDIEGKATFAKMLSGVSSLKVDSISKTGLRRSVGRQTLSVHFNSPNLAMKAASRFIIKPNLVNKIGAQVPEDASRSQPIFLRHPVTEIDSVSITLPPGFTVKSLPAPVSYEYEMGSYEAAFNVNPQTQVVTYYRKFVWNYRLLPASRYAEFREFVNMVYAADQVQLVLLGNT